MNMKIKRDLYLVILYRFLKENIFIHQKKKHLMKANNFIIILQQLK